MSNFSGRFAQMLRTEIDVRNRVYALDFAHMESYGDPPVIMYYPKEGHHGNFYGPAYTAILQCPSWRKRLEKVHTGVRRTLPKLVEDPGRKWRELDSSMSSDALLMNIFCTPGVTGSPAVGNMLGVGGTDLPEFGWRARVPLKSGRADRTEVDMCWDGLLIEAKLTESDFQIRDASVVEAYRDFDQVFAREELPRIGLRQTRWCQATEFAEEFTQEWEAEGDEEAARAYQAGIVARERQSHPPVLAYAGYQLIRNVLAAHALGKSFCVLHDARRPDLREAWYAVLKAVRSGDLRGRLKVLTWQELAGVLPHELQEFLATKYGILPSGRAKTQIGESG
jgi:hypothetical protein